MQRDVIRLPFNEPVRIRLDRGPEGAQKPSRYGGVDYLYSVNGGKGSLYLPPEGREALFECGAQAGDEVAIRKTRHGGGEFFEAEVIPNAHNGQNGHNPPNGNPPNGYDCTPPNSNSYPSRLLPSAEYYQQHGDYPERPAPRPGHPNGTPRPIAVERPIATRCGRCGTDLDPRNPSHTCRPANESRPAGQQTSPSHLASCLRAAIDAAADASVYALEKGMGITFLGSDIRAMANCLKIGDDRREAA